MRIGSIRKRPLVLIGIAVLIVITSVFIYRYQILQYTAEKLIRMNLPDYIRIDSIKFDFAKGEIALGGFRIMNPPGFTKQYLVEVGRITCRYKILGKNFTAGLELSDPVLSNASMNIERCSDGRLNLIEAESLIQNRASGTSPGGRSPTTVKASASGGSKLAGGIKLPEKCLLKGGSIVFIDSLPGSRPNILTFENINAEFTLKMDERYVKILSVALVGEGNVNGDRSQIVKWTIWLDPTTPRLTMSNKFDVYNVAIVPLQPYYDRYSPFVFKSGTFSGELIFNFENGMIGSTNEVRLAGITFFVKPQYANVEFWEASVPDLVKYFTSPYGEIIFDFKIKGDMSDPQFFLGPKTKAALVAMAVDKISEAVQKSAGSAGGAPKSDVEKAKEYIDMFRGLIKKQ